MPRCLLSDPEARSHLMHCVSILCSHFAGNQQRRSSRWRPDRAQPLQAVLGCSYPWHVSLHGNEDGMHHHRWRWRSKATHQGLTHGSEDRRLAQWESPFARWSEELRLGWDAEGSAEKKKLIRCCCHPCSWLESIFLILGLVCLLPPLSLLSSSDSDGCKFSVVWGFARN